MNRERISKAIEIIEYAIKYGMSVTETSTLFGFSNTYVKNTKALVYEKYEKGTLSDDDFNMFDLAYNRYTESRIENRKTQILKEEYVPIASPTRGLVVEPLNIVTNGNVGLNVVDPKSLLNVKDSNGQTIFEVKNNEATVEWKSGSNYPADHIKTLEQLLKACDVDSNLWNVKDYTVNKWDVTSWKKDNPETIQNFQVKARLEKNIAIERERAIGEMFKEMTKSYKAPVFDYKPVKPYLGEPLENNLFEVTLFDLHIGKLAWGGETGENYDTKIASQRFINTIETLINRASGFDFSRILFPVGSDFFNSDNLYNTTTKGTPQDEDLRWQKTFKVGCKLLVDAINLLKNTGVPVDVVVIPGNHDFERSYYMGEYLSAWFNNDANVNVNNGASPRKYYKFGDVLIGLTHGSEEKESSLPLLMASDIESKPLWSETKYHEWHVGHQHRKRDMKYVTLDASRMTSEDLGVIVRYLSSLTGTEEWHHKKGYIGQTKAGEAFIWNDKSGMIAHLNANLIIE